MATDPKITAERKALRSLDRTFRRFAVAYANGTPNEKLVIMFGFDSPDGPKILAKRLGIPAKIRRKRRDPLAYHQLGLPPSLLSNYLRKEGR